MYVEVHLIFLPLFVGNMSTQAAMHFVRLVEDDDSAFDNLFCVAFQMLDAQWLKRRATYMEFNVSILCQR
jgi:ELMO domain-containing protein